MAKGDVTIVVGVKEAGSLDAFRKLSADQQKLAVAFGKTAAGGEKVERSLNSASRRAKQSATAWSSLAGSLKSMAATAMGGYGLYSVFSNIAGSMAEATDKAIAFEKEITPLLSLGDNTKKISAIKDEVLDLSVAFRTSTADVADFLFTLQSSSANVAADVVRQIRDESLELAEVTGADLNTSLTALMKTYQIYGNELRTIDQLQNKLFISAERGWMSFQEMAALLPDVTNAAKTFGYSLDEVLGALTVATLQGGKTEKTFTGVRNIFLRMSNAAEQGIAVTGDLATDLQRLSSVDPQVLKKIFGDEAISVASVLLHNTKQLADEVERLAGVQEDFVQQRKELRETDPAFKNVTYMEMIRGAGDAATLRGGGTSAAQQLQLAFEEEIAGYKHVTPAFMHGFAWPAAWLGMGVRAITGQGMYSEVGQGSVANALFATGQEERATQYLRDRSGIGGFNAWGASSAPAPQWSGVGMGGVPIGAPMAPVDRSLVGSRYTESDVAAATAAQRAAAQELLAATEKWNRYMESLSKPRQTVALNAGV